MSLSRGAIISSSSKANTPRPGSGAREAQGSGGKDEDENEEVRADLYGACRPVASYQKLNQIGEVSHTRENSHAFRLSSREAQELRCLCLGCCRARTAMYTVRWSGRRAPWWR